MSIDVTALGKVIRDLRVKRGWSRYRLSDQSGVDSGQICLLEEGRKDNLTVETLNKLAKAFAVPAGRLASQAELKELAPPQTNPSKLLELKKALDKVGLKDLSFVGDIIQTPVRGYVRAGGVCMADQEEGEFLIIGRSIAEIISKRAEDIYALRIVGDSLSGDGVHDGDHVLVVPAVDAVVEGRIYIVRDPGSGETMVKHVNHRSNEVLLTSSNSKYPPVVIKQVEILGRVVYIQPQGKMI